MCATWPPNMSAYQDLFALWKDANPDLPALLEAKREYEKLPPAN